MELIHCDEIGGHQLVEVFADAPQLLRDCISKFEVFAVMASTRLAIVLTSEVVRYILELRQARPVMSALPPKADMCGATRHVRFVRIADIRPSRSAFNPRIDFTAQNPEIDRLGEKRFSAILQCLALGLGIAIGGDHDHRNVGSYGLGLGQHFKAGHPRHIDVGQDQ